ncbi:MAG: PQQ-binding-like beta-propeller repeat protein [Thermoleophilia bacterium]|nr:PQQ-binding-like beta-propeller repeat protein [Thermoleophilia bacterium]
MSVRELGPLPRLTGLPRGGATAAVAAAAILLLAGGGASAAGDAATSLVVARDWTRFGYDARRTNAAPSPTGITVGAVGRLRRQQVLLPGTVDSSPIYLHDVAIRGARHDAFFVTTTYGITLAVDADDGSILWRWTPPGYASWAGTYRITTASPVADPSRRWIYAASPDGRIQKLSVADGHAAWRVSITRLPAREKIAAALNFDRGHVIATTGGYIGDQPPYQGHVAIVDGRSGRLLHVWNSLCSDRRRLIAPASCPSSDSAIWGRAGAVVVPGSGELLVATGNAPWNGRTDWGDSVLLLNASATRLLGNYTPANTEQLNDADLDLGSSSPVLLGADLVAQGGKDGKIRLLSLRRLRAPGAHRDGELQIVSTPSGSALFTAPAVWRSGGRTWMLAADNGGTAAWVLEGGRLRRVWRNRNGGTSPVVAGGLLWVYDPSGGLRVYVPGTGRLVATLPAGPGHWNSPIVVDGRVALPEGNANDHRTSGVLDIWR